MSGDDAGQGWEVRSLSLFFPFFLVAELSGGSPRRPSPPPLLLETKGAFFSEEHSDVGGGCECGPCVRAAAAAAGAAAAGAAPFVCFPSPSSTPAPVQTSSIMERFTF